MLHTGHPPSVMLSVPDTADSTGDGVGRQGESRAAWATMSGLLVASSIRVYDAPSEHQIRNVLLIDPKTRCRGLGNCRIQLRHQ